MFVFVHHLVLMEMLHKKALVYHPKAFEHRLNTEIIVGCGAYQHDGLERRIGRDNSGGDVDGSQQPGPRGL